jgi:hypothetical protein
MLKFMRIFRAPDGFRSGSFDYEECGRKEDGSLIFVITGLEKRTGTRGKVAEFSCKEGDRVCRARVLKAIKKLNK